MLDFYTMRLYIYKRPGLLPVYRMQNANANVLQCDECSERPTIKFTNRI